MIEFAQLKNLSWELWNGIENYKWDFIKVEECSKLLNEQKIQQFMEKIQKKADVLPMMGMNPLLDLSWMSEAQRADFYQCTNNFLQDAKVFDTTLSDEEIFQALRNIWIILMLEIVFNKPIHYHKAMFAYSMLYPYSDNFLDDTIHSNHEKETFNMWFTKRLHGEDVNCETTLYDKIDQLVAMIEQQYDRSLYNDVYESLYEIQNAQILSQQQFQPALTPVYICDISITKGGASVLADGYLIDGSLNDTEKQFCMDFGFSLQIADDIQDVKEDQLLHSHTLASMSETKEQRAILFQKNLQLLLLCFRRYHVCDQDVENFIIKNCQLMMILSLFPQKELYSNIFIETAIDSLPVHEAFLNNIAYKMKHSSHFIQDYINE